MRLHNLTDRTRIDRAVGRKARDLLVFGQLVKPGSSVEVPDDTNLAKVAGWINNEMLCIGDPPTWYAKAGRSVTEDISVPVKDEGISARDSIDDVTEQTSKRYVRKATKK